MEPKITMLDSLRFSLGLYTVHKNQRALPAWGITGAFVRVGAAFLGIYIPKLAVDCLTRGVTPGVYALTLGCAALVLAGLYYLKGRTDCLIEDVFGTLSSYNTPLKIAEKLTGMAYWELEDPGQRKKEEKAISVYWSNHAPAANAMRNLIGVVTNALGLVLYTLTVGGVNPWLLALLAFTAGCSWLGLWAARRYEDTRREGRQAICSRIDYLSKQTQEQSLAKDIRMYSMLGWLTRIYQDRVNDLTACDRSIRNRYALARLLEAGLILLRDGTAYAYLIWLLTRNQLTVGDFVLLIAAVSGLAGWIEGLISQSAELLRSHRDIRQFLLWYKGGALSGSLPLPPETRDCPPTLALEDVSFRYPDSKTDTLSHICLTLTPGERIALVGVNGAGKTTLIKLLTGLLRPTEGRILLNGHPIGDYEWEAYFSLFAPVFQDIYLIPETVAMNISFLPREETDNTLAEACLREAGLWERIAGLPKRLDTMLVGTVHPDAVSFSGGELQKLALARALYRDAPLVVLDEPTAALDPKSEYEVYTRFDTLVQGNTSVYISHRLASCRFCDDIAVFREGELVQWGSHDTLENSPGLYREMWDAQAQYYRDAE